MVSAMTIVSLKRGQRRGVGDRLLQRVVDDRRLLADLVGEHQDRHDQRDDGEHDDDAERDADDPTGIHHTPSQKSATGLRFVFTETSRAGTVLVCCATDRDPADQACRACDARRTDG